jgi:uroporphyrinogen decarboxylase
MSYSIEGGGSTTHSKSKKWLYQHPATTHKLLKMITEIVFAKGGHFALKSLSDIGYDVVGLDWTVDPVKARAILGDKITLQGNMDPCALYSSKEDLDIKAKEQAEAFGVQRWIGNLGHGIYPDVDPDNLGAFLKSFHDHAREPNK